MKWNAKQNIHKHDKMYGVTTIGTKGQVVIPSEARKDLNLNPGDQLVVMGKFGKVLGLIKSDQLGSLIDMIMEHIPKSEKALKVKIKGHLEKMLSGI